MMSIGRITVARVLIFLWWTTTTTTLLLSSCTTNSNTQCFAAAAEEAADTAEGESMTTDAVVAAETASTDESNNSKKDQVVLRKTWTLFHSVDSTGQANDTSFTPRAKITLEAAVVNDDNNAAKPTPPVLTIENQADCLSPESVRRMMETQWYQLKLVEDDPADENSVSGSNAAVPPPILATVPACRMRLANFRDELVLTFGTNGHVISLASMPLVSPLAPPNCEDESLLPTLMKITEDGDYIKLESRISFATAVPGMMLRSVLPTYQPPPGLKYINTKSGSTGGAGAAAGAATDKPPPGVFGQDANQNKQQAPPDNSMFGFLSRYWYILAPIVLLNLFAPEAPPPAPAAGATAAAPGQPAAPQLKQQQGGAGGGAAVQQATPAASPVAPGPASPGDGARQRRGKRG